MFLALTLEIKTGQRRARFRAVGLKKAGNHHGPTEFIYGMCVNDEFGLRTSQTVFSVRADLLIGKVRDLAAR